MAILGSITTVVSGLGLATTSSSAATNEDGSINKTEAQVFLGTTVGATATTAVGNYLNNKGLDRIEERYKEKETSSYIDSLSDEQLEALLMKLDLLEAENFEKNNNKTV